MECVHSSLRRWRSNQDQKMWQPSASVWWVRLRRWPFWVPTLQYGPMSFYLPSLGIQISMLCFKARLKNQRHNPDLNETAIYNSSDIVYISLYQYSQYIISSKYKNTFLFSWYQNILLHAKLYIWRQMYWIFLIKIYVSNVA